MSEGGSYIAHAQRNAEIIPQALLASAVEDPLLFLTELRRDYPQQALRVWQNARQVLRCINPTGLFYAELWLWMTG